MADEIAVINERLETVNGIIAGVGAVLVFLPQIAVLFLLLFVFKYYNFFVQSAEQLGLVVVERVAVSKDPFAALRSLLNFERAIASMSVDRVREPPRKRRYSSCAPGVSPALQRPVKT